MGLFDWLDSAGFRDDHFGGRERKALHEENGKTHQESRHAIEKRARQALSAAAVKGRHGKGGKGK
jgi:hypothetical protein